MNSYLIVRNLACASLLLSCQSVLLFSQEVHVWGIQPASNQIVRVNPSTGSVFAGFTPPGGALLTEQLFGGLTIAEKGKTLLYQNPLTNPTDLFRIDPETGALLSTEFMPAAGEPDFRAGLSFESGVGASSADAIFAVNDGAPIQRQDGYGDATLENHFSTPVLFAGALGGDDTGRNFVVSVNSIIEFAGTAPEEPREMFPLPLTGIVAGLAFDGSLLYLSDNDGNLYTLDPDSGTVLNSVLVQGGPLIGLAARTIPEPSTLACLAMLSLTIAARRCRQRADSIAILQLTAQQGPPDR